MSALRIKPLTDHMDGMGKITVKQSGELRTIEREVEKQSRKETDLTPPPLITVPNRYTGKKFCRNCKAWKLLTQFSPLATMIDGRHTYCRACRAEKARSNYTPSMKWKRST